MLESYYHSKKEAEEYIRVAEEFDGALLIHHLRRFLSEGSEILELGSGPGKDWKILDAEFQVTGSDFSPAFLEYLRTHYPRGKFIELEASLLDTELNFDAIYSNKVLHHLDERKLHSSLLRQWEILREGGLICHSFWKGEGSEEFKGMHVNYQDEETIRAILEPLFNLRLVEVYQEFDQDDSIFIIAEKKTGTSAT